MYSDDGLTEIDFASNTVSQTSALDDVANGSRKADQLPADQRARVKDSLYVDWLSKVEHKTAPANAIEFEQKEFVQALQSGVAVTVPGEQGYQALEMAARILEQIAVNRPSRSIIPFADRLAKTKAA